MDALSEILLFAGIGLISFVAGFLAGIRFIMATVMKVLPIAKKARDMIMPKGGGNFIQTAGNAILQKILGGF